MVVQYLLDLLHVQALVAVALAQDQLILDLLRVAVKVLVDQVLLQEVAVAIQVQALLPREVVAAIQVQVLVLLQEVADHIAQEVHQAVHLLHLVAHVLVEAEVEALAEDNIAEDRRVLVEYKKDKAVSNISYVEQLFS